MDSLTQAVLGAGITVAVMHGRTAPWKAALAGAVAGTLPDLDVLLPQADPIVAMLRHRAETHALFWLSLASLPLAWVAARTAGPPAAWRRWWLALWLALVTHPLLDVLTMYGTRLLLPFSDQPFSIGSVFFVDPLVTLPWLVGVLIAVVAGRRRLAARATLAGLALGCVYLGFGLVAQQQVLQHARASLAAQGVVPERLLATPTPFNILLWRVVAVQPTVHHEGFVSLLDAPGSMRFTPFARGTEWLPVLQSHDTLQALRVFTQGFYKIERRGDQLLASDLRIAQEPDYEFRFVVAELRAEPTGGPARWVLREPSQAVEAELDDLPGAFGALWRRALGDTTASVGAQAADSRSRLD
jgi:inner membrane protein